MKIRNCTIIGLGALGTLFGKLIQDNLGAGSVRFLASADRIERYQKNPVYCNGERCDFSFVSEDDTTHADLVIFAVKWPDLPDAIRAVRNQVGEHTVIISLLNGITSEEMIAEAYGWEHVLLAVAQGMDATRLGTQLTYSSPGQIVFGDRNDERTEAVEAVAEFFEQAGINYTISDDIHRQLWSKYMLNVGCNQAVMAFETNYAGIQTAGQARDVMLSAMREVIQVADAEGVRLTEEDVLWWMNLLATFNSENCPSMRQDALAKRKTEVEMFSGVILAKAKRYGISVPTNEWLYRRILELESEYGE